MGQYNGPRLVNRAMSDKNKRSAIIVVLYNPSAEDIQNVVALSSAYGGIVVDNSPSRTFRASKINLCDYVWLGRNMGIGFAQAHALRMLQAKAGYGYAVFLDQDSRPPGQYVERITAEYIKAQGTIPRLAFLGPTVTNRASQEQYGKATGKEHFVPRRNIISSGCCVSLEALATIGLPDASLFLDFVDSEWCWRAESLGYQNAQTSRLLLKHQIGIKTVKLGFMRDIISAPVRYYYQYRNFIWLLRVSYVPASWKIRNGIRFALRLAYLPFYVKSCHPYYKNILKGIYDGVTKQRKK